MRDERKIANSHNITITTALLSHCRSPPPFSRSRTLCAAKNQHSRPFKQELDSMSSLLTKEQEDQQRMEALTEKYPPKFHSNCVPLTKHQYRRGSNTPTATLTICMSTATSCSRSRCSDLSRRISSPRTGAGCGCLRTRSSAALG
jgi:hypothetical protein